MSSPTRSRPASTVKFPPPNSTKFVIFGATPFGIRGTASVEPDVMSRAVSEADLVVAHAGVGSALMALDAGHCPVLLPRRANHGEHVDDHQILLAGELNRRGLALARDPDALTTSDLRRAMARATTTVGRTAPVRLS